MRRLQNRALVRAEAISPSKTSEKFRFDSAGLKGGGAVDCAFCCFPLLGLYFLPDYLKNICVCCADLARIAGPRALITIKSKTRLGCCSHAMLRGGRGGGEGLAAGSGYVVVIWYGCARSKTPGPLPVAVLCAHGRSIRSACCSYHLPPIRIAFVTLEISI